MRDINLNTHAMTADEANLVLDFRPMMLGWEEKQAQERRARISQRKKRQREREEIILFWRSLFLVAGMFFALAFMPVLVDLLSF